MSGSTKRCPDCGQQLALQNFTKASRCKDGLSPYCRACTSARNRANYARNQKDLVAKAAAYRAEHRELLNAKLHEWQEAHRCHIREYGQRNAASRRAAGARYRRRHQALVRSRYASRRASYRTPPWANQKKIIAVYVEAARKSRLTGIPHEVDHIVPLQSKLVCGLHCESNLQVITRSENRAKSNHVRAGAIAQRGMNP